MKKYSHTALGLLIASATVTGCYSERVEYIQGEHRGDAGTRANPPGPSGTTETTDAKSGHVDPHETTAVDTDFTDAPDRDSGKDTSDTEATTGDSTSLPAPPVDPTSALTSDGESTTLPPTPVEDSFLAPLPANGNNNGGGWGDGTGAAGAPPAGTTTPSSPTTPGATGGTGATGGEEPVDGEQDPQQVIAEADILKRNGDIVYALSYIGGLAVIDVSNPADLVLLGSRHFEQTPFEMYIDGNEAVVLFYGSGGSYYTNYYGGYEDTTEKSKIGIYDLTQPSALAEVDSAEISGSLIDSRKIGDRLYVATNNYCYWCDNGGARVGSFDLAGSGVAPIDEVVIPDEGNWGYAPTLYVNDQRLYLARTGWGYVDSQGNPVPDEVAWGGSTSGDNSGESDSEGQNTVAPAATSESAGTDEPTPNDDTFTTDGGTGNSSPSYQWAQWSSLQVVDISDDSGDLTLGANVRIDGQVNNRWQMDEHEGVLRVISQNGWWGPAPVVETFTVTNSATVTAIARAEIVLPRPETLRSVRFDGDRAFAVTFEQTDPLFTLDLSDPAAPKQLGELEMPGFLYHMIPRGDRLYAVGYDNGNAQGSLHASVFDVSNLANPQLLSRVNFGGNWGWFAEDQDRIEKSVQLLDAQGLILIPFTGYDYEGDCGWGETRSGVQLIDFTADTLTLRGATDAVGYARRAFYHRDHLFGYSDQALQSFDITDRDNPVAVDALPLGWSVESVAVVGDQLVRIGNDGLEHPVLDVVPVTQPDAPLQQNALALPDDACGYGYYGAPIVHEGKLLLPRQGYDYTLNASVVSVSAFDVSDAAGPRLLSQAQLPQSENSYNSAVWLEANDALVALQVSETWEWVPNNGADGGAPMETWEPAVSDIPAVIAPVATTPPMMAVLPEATQSDDSNTEVVEVSDAPGDAGVGWNSGGYYYDTYYGNWYGGYTRYSRSARLSVVDLRDVDEGMAVTNLDVPQEWMDNGFARGPTNVGVEYASPNAGAYGLVVGGNVVASQHAIRQADGLRYYIDRLDVTNPSTPTWLPEANIPGAVVSLAADDTQLVTVDEVALALAEADCIQSGGNYVVCYNRAVELSALTLETNRAVRTKRLRLGSSRQPFYLGVDDSAVYVMAYDGDELRAYSQDLDDLGQVALDENGSRYLSQVAEHVASYQYYPAGYQLYSTSGNTLHSAGFINRETNRCYGSWTVAGTEAYCANGYGGVVHTTLE